MSFIDDLWSDTLKFNKNLLNNISGGARKEREEAELRAKLGIVTTQTENERQLELARLEQAERLKPILYITGGVVLVVLIFSYFYFRRR